MNTDEWIFPSSCFEATISPRLHFFYQGPGNNIDIGDPSWGIAAVIIPFQYYLRTGDKHALVKHHPIAKRYIEFLALHGDPKLNNLTQWGWFGDWVSVPVGIMPIDFGSAWSHITGVQALVAMAEAMQLKEDVEHYSAQLEALRAAFNAKYWNADTRTYLTGSQSILACPLYADIPDAKDTAAVVAALVARLKSDNMLLKTGTLGTRAVFEALSNNGQAAVALDLALQQNGPGSYLHMLNLGPGTLWEVSC